MTDLLPMTRRAFVGSFAAASLSLTFGPRAAFAQTTATPRPRRDADYAFVLLGDLHFDKPEHHDMDWVRREKAGDIRQIEGYIASTRDHMPRLFQRVAQVVQTCPAPVVAVVNIGDLTEGLCGSRDLQALQFRDATAFVDGNQLGVPFLLTKGNHDITGPGADEAFDDTLLPWMSRQAGASLANANYTWRRGDDLFVFFDAYRPDLDWLASLDAQAAAARHVFFVIHPPVVPYNARSTWHVFSKDTQADERARLLAWLGQHGATVLSGHLHRFGYVRRTTNHGPFTQLAINSVIRHEVEQPRDERTGLDAYGPDLTELEPKFSPDTIDNRRAMLTAEAPHITDFAFAQFPGYAVLYAYRDAIEADVSLGTDPAIWTSRAL